MTPVELRRVQARLPSVLPYMRLMVEIRREMRRVVQAELLRPLESIVRLDAADDYAQRFANLEVKWAQATSEKALGRKLRKVAEQTQAHAAREQTRILRRPIDSQLEESTRGFVRENVNLVTKMSREQLAAMKELVNESTQAQWSYKELRARIIEQFGLSKSRAALIARDQTLKHNAQVTRKMHEDAGIRRYRWVTSRDERVRGTPGGKWPRGLHYSLDGQVFSYDDPPVVDEKTGRRENPGGDYTCRCTAVPLADDLLYPDEDEPEPEAEERALPEDLAVEQAREESTQALREYEDLQTRFSAGDRSVFNALADAEYEAQKARDRLEEAERRAIAARIAEPGGARFAPARGAQERVERARAQVRDGASVDDALAAQGTQGVWQGWSGESGTYGWYAGSGGPKADIGRYLVRDGFPDEIARIARQVDLPEHAPVQEFTRDLYGATQEALAKRLGTGPIDEDGFVTLYRGVGGQQGSLLRDAVEQGGELRVKVRSLSSWTTDLEIAENFSSGGGAILEKRVHVSRVIQQWEEQAYSRVESAREKEWILVFPEEEVIVDKVR